jgi:hypothetical protein
VIYWEDSGTIRGKDRTLSLAPFTVNATLQQVRLAIAGKMVRNKDGFVVKVEEKKTPEPPKKATPPVKKAAAQASPTPPKPVESKPEPQPEKAPAQENSEKKEDAKDLALDAVQA